MTTNPQDALRVARDLRELVDLTTHQYVTVNEAANLLEALAQPAQPETAFESAANFFRQRDKLNVLKDGTVGHLIAVNAVKDALSQPAQEYEISPERARAYAEMPEVDFIGIAKASLQQPAQEMSDDEIIAHIDRPGFAWENLTTAEQRNLLGSIQELLSRAAQQAKPTAWKIIDASGVEPLCTVYSEGAANHYTKCGYKVVPMIEAQQAKEK